ncbi:MAG: hypothetical protein IJ787_06190 [Bacilli bacterium]|nr:hypothetical protein [Bacilli bacterium]
MPCENRTNVEARLIDFLNDKVHECAMPLYRTKEEYPIERNFMLANAFYAKVLSDVIMGVEPTVAQFNDMPFKEGPEVVYQSAVYLYYCWRTLGIIGAVRSYCQNLNRLFENSVKASKEKTFSLLPDFISYEGEIYNELLRLQSSAR